MRQGGREGQGIPLVEPIALPLADPDGHRAGDHIQELLTGVVVGALAARSGREPKELRFQERSRIRELFDVDRVVAKLDDWPSGGMDNPARPSRLREELAQGGAIGAGQPLQARHARPRSATFHRAQEADRQAHGDGGVAQGETMFLPHGAEAGALAQPVSVRHGRRLSREEALDARGIDALLPHATDTAQQVEVGVAVQPIASRAAHGAHEPLTLPAAQGARRYADPLGGLPDAIRGGAQLRGACPHGRRMRMPYSQDGHGARLGTSWRRAWRRCQRTCAAMARNATTKISVPSTLTSGGTPRRLTPNTHSGKVMVLPATNEVIT